MLGWITLWAFFEQVLGELTCLSARGTDTVGERSEIQAPNSAPKFGVLLSRRMPFWTFPTERLRMFEKTSKQFRVLKSLVRFLRFCLNRRTLKRPRSGRTKIASASSRWIVEGLLRLTISDYRWLSLRVIRRNCYGALGRNSKTKWWTKWN